MPAFCGVVGCSNNSARDKISFFRLPQILQFKHKVELNNLSQKRREKWINSLRRADLTETKLKYLRICSKHFITGKPADLTDSDNPDWVPSVDMGYTSTSTLKNIDKIKRKQRLEERECKKQKIEDKIINDESRTFVMHTDDAQVYASDDCSKSIQTDLSSEDISIMKLKLIEMNAIEKKLKSLGIDECNFVNNDKKTRYFTGLNSFKKLKCLMNYIINYMDIHPNSSLNPFQQVLLTLMKLRLNTDFKGLGYLFHITGTSASNYFKKTLLILYDRLKKLIIWPTRETLLRTIPSAFKESFPNKAIFIVDCFEIFMETPSDMVTAAQCWSHYKHHHTVKYLIGITPQGTICYISDAWGGRTSDKHLTINSNFLDNLLPGDVILADKGFLIQDYVRAFHSEVVIPAFTKGKSQSHPTDIERSRTIANVRIHVERVIGVIKQKYRILNDSVTITLASVLNEPTLDQIVAVCCSLVNISPPIVPM